MNNNDIRSTQHRFNNIQNAAKEAEELMEKYNTMKKENEQLKQEKEEALTKLRIEKEAREKAEREKNVLSANYNNLYSDFSKLNTEEIKKMEESEKNISSQKKIIQTALEKYADPVVQQNSCGKDGDCRVM